MVTAPPPVIKNWILSPKRLSLISLKAFLLLDREEIRAQRGYNELKAAKKKTMFQRFLDQFKDFSISIALQTAKNTVWL